jgi:hypothetical protein
MRAAARQLMRATFRCDVNADGNINAPDIGFVKSLAGTVLR